MASSGSTIASKVTPVVPEVSAKQNGGRPTRHKKQRMIYGFTFSTDELEEWGKRRFGDTDDEGVLESYIRRSMGPLFTRCYRLWRRTTKHFVTYRSGPRRYESDWCLTLADNISPDTMTPPPRDIIDKIKEDLQLTRDPQWHRFNGD